jgi:hypothetical protein
MLTRLRRVYALGGALVIALNVGCASAVPPITLQGAPSDLQSLVGEWQGEYTSPTTGRSGLIWFTLIAGEDHAHGDVMMTPRGQEPYSRYGPGQAPTQDQRRRPTQFLSVRFVRASDGRLSGTLDPYWDPDCQCNALTTFRGRLSEDTIEGTFAIRLERGAGESNGRWTASRKRVQAIFDHDN